MVVSLAWGWLFKSKHVALALTHAIIISLCWRKCILIKWIYGISTQRDDFIQQVTALLKRCTGKWWYCSILNVSTENSKNMAVCTVPISFMFILLQVSHHFQAVILRNGLYDESKVRQNFASKRSIQFTMWLLFCVAIFCWIAVVWSREPILTSAVH